MKQECFAIGQTDMHTCFVGCWVLLVALFICLFPGPQVSSVLMREEHVTRTAVDTCYINLQVYILTICYLASMEAFTPKAWQ